MTDENAKALRQIAYTQFAVERRNMPDDRFHLILEANATWPTGYDPVDDVFWCRPQTSTGDLSYRTFLWSSHHFRALAALD